MKFRLKDIKNGLYFKDIYYGNSRFTDNQSEAWMVDNISKASEMRIDLKRKYNLDVELEPIFDTKTFQ